MCPAQSPGLYIHSLSTITDSWAGRPFTTQSPVLWLRPTSKDLGLPPISVEGRVLNGYQLRLWNKAKLHNFCLTSDKLVTTPGIKALLAKMELRKYNPQSALALVCSACHNKIPDWQPKQQKIISHSSGGWKSKSKVPAGLVSGESSLLSLQMAFSPCPHIAFLLCGGVCGGRALASVPLLIRTLILLD